MQRTGKLTVCGMITAVFLTIFIFSFAVVATLYCRWLYYWDISFLHLPQISGMSAEAIRENFDALIDYNLLWHQEALYFPSLPMSKEGSIHFAQVKVIFDLLQITLVISGIASLVSGIFQSRRHGRRWLRVAGIFCAVIPCGLGALAAVNWEAFFVGFHQLVFRNDYWLFDPVTDPVIKMLPDAYFLQCAVCILVLIAIGSMICFVSAGNRKNEMRRQRCKLKN